MKGTQKAERQAVGMSLRLAGHVADALQASIPAFVMEQAAIHVLDTIGAIVSGYDLLPGKLARDLVSTSESRAEATLLSTGRAATAEQAAFANAMAAHADETDDAHPASITHPGCAVVPAALAVSERFGRSGAEMLKAVVLGYDFCARTGIALGAGGFLTEHGFDPHAFGGTIGAAAAAAALAGPDVNSAADALSYAAQQASGVGFVFRDHDHVQKAFVFAGKPARDGVSSALMAAAGFTGVRDAFDGEWSFWHAFQAADAQAAFESLGGDYAVCHTNIKRWSVGSPAQAVLDCIEALHAEHALVPEEIDEILVALPVEGARVVDDRDMPSINVQHLTALMIVDGGMGFASSHDEARMRDPRVLKLRQRVRLKPSEALSRAEPSRQAIVEIAGRDGSRRKHHAQAVRGTIDKPMDFREVADKCRDLMAPRLGVKGAQTVIAAVADLPDAPSVQRLVTAFAKAEENMITEGG